MMQARHARRLAGWIVVSLAVAMLVAACDRPLSPDPTATPTATATATPSPTSTSTSTPAPTPTPTVTPSPTPFIPPTVAVSEDESVRSCIEHNLTPELLYTLAEDDDSLANDILRTCLETQLPSAAVWLLGPIIDQTSECAVDVSKTLSNQDLIDLARPDGQAKDAVISRVTDDILTCVADAYHIPIGWFD